MQFHIRIPAYYIWKVIYLGTSFLQGYITFEIWHQRIGPMLRAADENRRGESAVTIPVTIPERLKCGENYSIAKELRNLLVWQMYM